MKSAGVIYILFTTKYGRLHWIRCIPTVTIDTLGIKKKIIQILRLSQCTLILLIML